jgi:rod shape-determining protein MreD
LLNHGYSVYIDPDIVSILIAYQLSRVGRTSAGVFAFIQGALMDIFSAGFVGLFTLLTIALFFAILIGSRFFNIRSFTGVAIIVLLANLLKELLLLFFIVLFSPETGEYTPGMGSMAVSVVITSLIAPIVFGLLDYVYRIHERETTESL